ncbi:hypothetical protein QKW35_10235 [Pontibacterium granulatum]|uniref:hypothetical protein n=1 Tax=Pontibacterium granulatum TaxID=2036029 RepID=UPI00249B3AE3|nr:hypothetical protein [Pontibacterium granulatum]MDI3324754.1 hypothetical protein [Pontibacterium granulatum]
MKALQGIYDFMVNGSYTFVHEAMAQAVQFAVVGYFTVKGFVMEQLWLVGKAVLDQLDLSTLIQTHWGHLDSNLMAFLTRYRVPEAANLILNSHITVWLWRMMT